MQLTKPLILASRSPRRHQLMREAGYDFIVKPSDADETHPPQLKAEEVAAYLARKKAEVFIETEKDAIVMTADTIVVKDGRILGKPFSVEEAREMLKLLSDTSHLVVTGLAFLHDDMIETFDDITEVWFKTLSAREIDYYIERYKPFDKAGAYGIQEWIGMIGIDKIAGSYFNVVGLPLHKVHAYLQRFASS